MRRRRGWPSRSWSRGTVRWSCASAGPCSRSARCRGRVPGHVPRAGAARPIDPQEGIGGELAARRRPPGGAGGPVGGGPSSAARGAGGRRGRCDGGAVGTGRGRRGGPGGGPGATGAVPGRDRAVRPGGPHRGAGRAAARVADRDGAHAVAAGPGAASRSVDPARAGARDRRGVVVRSGRGGPGGALRPEGCHRRGGGPVRDGREGPGRSPCYPKGC